MLSGNPRREIDVEQDGGRPGVDRVDNSLSIGRNRVRGELFVLAQGDESAWSSAVQRHRHERGWRASGPGGWGDDFAAIGMERDLVVLVNGKSDRGRALCAAVDSGGV